MKNPHRERAIDSAIRSWTDAYNGVYGWHNDFAKEHSKEYCKEQIKYFKEMKKKNI